MQWEAPGGEGQLQTEEARSGHVSWLPQTFREPEKMSLQIVISPPGKETGQGRGAHLVEDKTQ